MTPGRRARTAERTTRDTLKRWTPFVLLLALEAILVVGDGALLVVLTLDVLLPHAAISRVAAPAATTVANEVCLTVSSTGPDCQRPGLTRAFPRSDCPEIISPMYPV